MNGMFIDMHEYDHVFPTIILFNHDIALYCWNMFIVNHFPYVRWYDIITVQMVNDTSLSFLNGELSITTDNKDIFSRLYWVK